MLRDQAIANSRFAVVLSPPPTPEQDADKAIVVSSGGAAFRCGTKGKVSGARHQAQEYNWQRVRNN